MSDNLKQRGPQDRTRINVHESWELAYWAEKFNVSHERLKKAVETVGVSAEKVEKYLEK